MDAGDFRIHSLVWQTELDVLPSGAEVVRRDGYWRIRSPQNPAHYWGNWLLFDRPPGASDRAMWLERFESELPEAEHRLFAWDTVGGEEGAAAEAFPEYELDALVGLIVRPDELVVHPSANREVEVDRLDPDGPGWDEVLGIWLALNDESDNPHPAAHHRRYVEQRLADLRSLFRARRGGWFVARRDGVIVGSLGVVVTGPRARYQSVDVLAAHRRQGIARRLVLEAAQLTVAAHPQVERLVICAERDYHALGIYEGLGFRRVEALRSVLRRPPG